MLEYTGDKGLIVRQEHVTLWNVKLKQENNMQIKILFRFNLFKRM